MHSQSRHGKAPLFRLSAQWLASPSDSRADSVMYEIRRISEVSNDLKLLFLIAVNS